MTPRPTKKLVGLFFRRLFTGYEERLTTVSAEAVSHVFIRFRIQMKVVNSLEIEA